LSEPEAQELETSGGKFRLFEYRLRAGAREWTVWHTGTVLTTADEMNAISSKPSRLPYGVSLWPSAIALSHQIANRAEAFDRRRVLELGAGLGQNQGFLALRFWFVNRRQGGKPTNARDDSSRPRSLVMS
jgi:hypothetical protein